MDIYVPGWPLPCQMSPSKELMTHGHRGSLVLRHLTNLAWIGSHPLDEKLARHTHERAPKTTPPRLVWFVLPSHNLHTHTCHWPWAPLRIHTNCAIVAFISQCLHGYHCVCSLLVEVKGGWMCFGVAPVCQSNREGLTLHPQTWCESSSIITMNFTCWPNSVWELR